MATLLGDERMPRNKAQQDRSEKRTEIVDAARGLFLKAGYEATSMSAVAAAAGVAPNTIYWYFKDKDEVLVAVLDHELATGMEDFLNFKGRDSAARLLWIVDRLGQVSQLVATVHNRSRVSPVIGEWHDRFHEMSDMLARMELHDLGLPAARVDALVKIWAFTVEGLLSHPMTAEQKRTICTELARWRQPEAKGLLKARR